MKEDHTKNIWGITGMIAGLASMMVLFIVAVDTILSPILSRDSSPGESRAPTEEAVQITAPISRVSHTPNKRVTVEEYNPNADPLFGWDIVTPEQASVHSFTLEETSPISDIRGQFAISEGYLASRLPGPLKKHAGSFVRHGSKYGMNPLFLAAISIHETGRGTSSAFRNRLNAMGISSSSGPRTMKSVDYSIEYMAKRLASPTGYYKNCHTVEQFADVYAPSKVRVKNDPTGLNRHWPSKVRYYMNEMLPTLASS